MQLVDYWPQRNFINECIGFVAETLSEAVFLSVHQPAQFVMRQIGSARQTSTKTESDLLDYFLNDNLPSGILLMPIIGSSGIGKSHTIRWIDAQLRRRSDSDRLHIIRIPKSASLKRVLELILKGLQGDEFDNIRKELLAAHEDIDVGMATLNLRTNLRIALDRFGEAANNRIADARQLNQMPSNEDLSVAAHCRPECLQALIDDPETGKWFIGGEGIGTGLLQNLSHRVIKGHHSEKEKQFQFSEKDLIFDESIDFSQASAYAKRYYTLIDRRDGEKRKEAVKILNRAIDGAIAQLLNLDKNNLTDLFIRIREELLSEGKELVILIEDFAALAGVQGTLLDAVIKEAVRDGEQVLCTMRTALAVTEGYISDRDTVLTRAQYEWFIDDIPHRGDPESTIKVIIEMVGSYLNAARFGQVELDLQYNKSANKDLLSWIPCFDGRDDLEEDDRNILDIFGYSQRNYALFPFSKSAVRQFAEKYLTSYDGNITLNPRLIINQIIRPLLIDHRNSFKFGTFPKAGLFDFNPAKVTAVVRREVQDYVKDVEEQQRYLALLRYWGDRPNSIDSLIRVPNEIFKAFGLQPLKVKQEPFRQEKPSPGRHKKTGETQRQVKSPKIKDLSLNEKWKQRLDDWSSGNELGQVEANQLRRWIAEGVSSYIDWDANLLKNPGLKDTYYLKWVYIPGARGGEPRCNQANAMVTVCRDGEQNDQTLSTSIVLSLLALVNYQSNESLDYENSEEDFAMYANFMERASKQALQFIKKRYLRTEVDAVPVLTQALLAGAKVLNLPGANSRNETSTVEAVTALIPSDYELSGNVTNNWKMLIRHCEEARKINTKGNKLGTNKFSLLEALLLQISARQGGGSVRAVDAVRIIGAVKSIRRTLIIDVPELKTSERTDASVLISKTRDIKSLSGTSVKERATQLAKWRYKMLELLGEELDKKTFIEASINAISEIRKYGIDPGKYSYSQLQAYVNELWDIPLKENLTSIEKLDKADLGNALSILSQIDEISMSKAEHILDALDQFFDTAIANLNAILNAEPNHIVRDTERNVEQIMTELIRLPDRMVEGVCS